MPDSGDQLDASAWHVLAHEIEPRIGLTGLHRYAFAGRVDVSALYYHQLSIQRIENPLQLTGIPGGHAGEQL
jgi:hypothetical protein